MNELEGNGVVTALNAAGFRTLTLQYRISRKSGGTMKDG
jgi:hypothetical protein